MSRSCLGPHARDGRWGRRRLRRRLDPYTATFGSSAHLILQGAPGIEGAGSTDRSCLLTRHLLVTQSLEVFRGSDHQARLGVLQSGRTAPKNLCLITKEFSLFHDGP
jgi:hypothetical protein